MSKKSKGPYEGRADHCSCSCAEAQVQPIGSSVSSNLGWFCNTIQETASDTSRITKPTQFKQVADNSVGFTNHIQPSRFQGKTYHSPSAMEAYGIRFGKVAQSNIWFKNNKYTEEYAEHLGHMHLKSTCTQTSHALKDILKCCYLEYPLQ